MIRLAIICVVWMALSAVIAYLADSWGRKLGKKRKTLWGLRPKNTAILIISSTGALMSLVSFLLLFGISSSIRKPLMHFDEVQRRNRELTSERQGLQADIAAQQSIGRHLTSSNTALDQKNTLLQQSVVASRKEADIAANRTQLLLHQADVLRTQVTHGEAQVLSLKSQSSILRAQVEVAKVDLTTARSKLRVANVNLTQASDVLVRQTRQLVDQTNQFVIARADTAKARRDRDEAQAQYAEATRQLAAAQFKYTTVQADLQDLQTKLQTVQNRVNQLQAGNVVVRRSELARIVVPKGVSVDEAHGYLKQLLADASDAVSSANGFHGAAFSTGRPLVSVVSREVNDDTMGGSSHTREIQPSEVQDLVAQTLADKSGETDDGVVVRVVAKENTIAGDTVPVDFELFTNRKVFDKGQEIASVMVDPSQSQDDIVDQLKTVLNGSVHEAAVQKGLMPSADDSVGVLAPQQLGYTVVAIKGPVNQPRTKSVRVRFLAANTTWTAGPLQIKFEVVP